LAIRNTGRIGGFQFLDLILQKVNFPVQVNDVWVFIRVFGQQRGALG
jgi:hypothetical protein